MSSTTVPVSNPNRESLTSRVLPQMVLSNGSITSHTAAPAPTPVDATHEERARLRFEVKGNAIVTGGAGTLGLSAARSLLEHGLSGLMIFDINPSISRTQIASLQLSFPSAQIETLAVDITNEFAVAAAIKESASLLGSIHHLLCFAGVVDCTPAIDMTASSWRRTMEINTTGSFICAQEVAKQMIIQGSGGSIVFISSISGHRVNFPQPQVSYNVSKSALLTLKNGLAAEWARYGIRVNSISPGYMDTILNEGDGIAEARGIWAARNPMGRMGTPHELTGAVVLLSSSAGSYMTASDIVVDGGQIVF